jgi:hypothetical protein
MTDFIADTECDPHTVNPGLSLRRVLSRCGPQQLECIADVSARQSEPRGPHHNDVTDLLQMLTVGKHGRT